MASSHIFPIFQLIHSLESYQEFISAGVNAYALGCTDEGLRKELIRMKDSGSEIEGLQSHSGGTTLKFEILTEEVRSRAQIYYLLHFLHL